VSPFEIVALKIRALFRNDWDSRGIRVDRWWQPHDYTSAHSTCSPLRSIHRCHLSGNFLMDVVSPSFGIVRTGSRTPLCESSLLGNRQLCNGPSSWQTGNATPPLGCPPVSQRTVVICLPAEGAVRNFLCWFPSIFELPSYTTCHSPVILKNLHQFPNWVDIK
jgi:hypothetical protein